MLLNDNGVFVIVTPIKEIVSAEKQKIAIKEEDLYKALEGTFTIKHKEDIKSGRLLVLKKPNNL